MTSFYVSILAYIPFPNFYVPLRQYQCVLSHSSFIHSSVTILTLTIGAAV